MLGCPKRYPPPPPKILIHKLAWTCFCRFSLRPHMEARLSGRQDSGVEGFLGSFRRPALDRRLYGWILSRTGPSWCQKLRRTRGFGVGVLVLGICLEQLPQSDSLLPQGVAARSAAVPVPGSLMYLPCRRQPAIARFRDPSRGARANPSQQPLVAWKRCCDRLDRSCSSRTLQAAEAQPLERLRGLL